MNPASTGGAPDAASRSSTTSACVEARVWLFGMLAEAGVERPLRLALKPSASLADVLLELRPRLGADALGRMVDANGALLRQCRVFVNGEQADGADAPLAGRRGHAEVEIIVLSAAEGG